VYVILLLLLLRRWRPLRPRWQTYMLCHFSLFSTRTHQSASGSTHSTSFDTWSSYLNFGLPIGLTPSGELHSTLCIRAISFRHVLPTQKSRLFLILSTMFGFWNSSLISTLCLILYFPVFLSMQEPKIDLKTFLSSITMLYLYEKK